MTDDKAISDTDSRRLDAQGKRPKENTPDITQDYTGWVLAQFQRSYVNRRRRKKRAENALHTRVENGVITLQPCIGPMGQACRVEVSVDQKGGFSIASGSALNPPGIPNGKATRAAMETMLLAMHANGFREIEIKDASWRYIAELKRTIREMKAKKEYAAILSDLQIVRLDGRVLNERKIQPENKHDDPNVTAATDTTAPSTPNQPENETQTRRRSSIERGKKRLNLRDRANRILGSSGAFGSVAPNHQQWSHTRSAPVVQRIPSKLNQIKKKIGIQP